MNQVSRMDEQLFRMKPMVVLTDIMRSSQFKNSSRLRCKRFSCRACRTVCWSKKEIATHVIKHHKNTCNLCGKRFTKSGYRLYKHWKSSHSKHPHESAKEKSTNIKGYPSTNVEDDKLGATPLKQEPMDEIVGKNENQIVADMSTAFGVVDRGRQLKHNRKIRNRSEEARGTNNRSLTQLISAEETSNGSLSPDSRLISSVGGKSSSRVSVQELRDYEEAAHVAPILAHSGMTVSYGRTSITSLMTKSMQPDNTSPAALLKLIPQLPAESSASTMSSNMMTPVRGLTVPAISGVVVRSLESFGTQPLTSPVANISDSATTLNPQSLKELVTHNSIPPRSDNLTPNASSSFTTPATQSLVAGVNPILTPAESLKLTSHVIRSPTMHVMTSVTPNAEIPVGQMSLLSPVADFRSSVNPYPMAQLADQFNQSSALHKKRYGQGYLKRKMHYTGAMSRLKEFCSSTGASYFGRAIFAPPTRPAPSFESSAQKSPFLTLNEQPSTSFMAQYHKPGASPWKKTTRLDSYTSPEQSVSYLWCCLCQRYILNDLTTAQTHLRTNHGAYLINQSEKKILDQTSPDPYVCLSCPHCPFRTGDAQQLAVHIAKEHAVSMSKCDQCDYQTLFTKLLEDHKRSYHSLLACTYCPMKLKNSTELLKHLNDNHFCIT